MEWFCTQFTSHVWNVFYSILCTTTSQKPDIEYEGQRAYRPSNTPHYKTFFTLNSMHYHIQKGFKKIKCALKYKGQRADSIDLLIPQSAVDSSALHPAHTAACLMLLLIYYVCVSYYCVFAMCVSHTTAYLLCVSYYCISAMCLIRVLMGRCVRMGWGCTLWRRVQRAQKTRQRTADVAHRREVWGLYAALIEPYVIEPYVIEP